MKCIHLELHSNKPETECAMNRYTISTLIDEGGRGTIAQLIQHGESQSHELNNTNVNVTAINPLKDGTAFPHWVSSA